jgi:hypothetical protein
MTRDHVVPQSLWGGKGNLPANVVIVPACPECQQKWDMQAEYFRNTTIAMIDRNANPVATKLLEGPMIRSLRRNEKACAAFFRNPRILPRTSPSGIFTGYGVAFQIDLKRFLTVPEKIVRGLFFFKSQVPLSRTHTVQFCPGDQFWADEGCQNVMAAMEPSVGDGVFQVRCTRDASDPNCTAWLLIFYRAIGFFAWTEAILGQSTHEPIIPSDRD